MKEWSASFLHRLRYPLSSVFAWTVTALGLIGGSIALLDSLGANTTIREWVLSLALAIIAIGALLTLAIREMKLTRRSKLVSVLSHLERASDLLRDLRIFLFRRRDAKSATGEDLSRVRGMIEEVLSIA